ncbi:hypothetical protein TWF788_002257 [Orbilia oligospora]|uniref:Uncharacterized protein n=2 Tax=Orbilia oligospora TaxID=2813651 RepID=A0A7C8U876_ORBOL|nr:hypothetical protein TWF788_002257 [Orbilia oligospora]
MLLLYILVFFSLFPKVILVPFSEAPTSTLTSKHVQATTLSTSTSPTAINAEATKISEGNKVPPEKDLPNPDTSYSLNKEPKRVIHNGIFWAPWKVVCPPISAILEMPPEPRSYSMIDNFRRPDFRATKRPRDSVSTRRIKCLHCICDQDGNVLPNPDAVPPGTPSKSHKFAVNCNNMYDVGKCKEWFNCRCQTTMLNPDREEGVPLSEYQDALNQVPFSVKQQYPGFRWRPFGLDMSWSSMTAGNFYPPENQQVERWLAPGTAEPYYLEGKSQDPATEWMTGLSPGFKGRGNLEWWAMSGESSFTKRSLTDAPASIGSSEPENQYGDDRVASDENPDY